MNEEIVRKSDYDLHKKIKKKPTLYFMPDEVDTLDEMQREGRSWGKTSLATTIEDIVRKEIIAFREKKKKEQEKAKKDFKKSFPKVKKKKVKKRRK